MSSVFPKGQLWREVGFSGGKWAMLPKDVVTLCCGTCESQLELRLVVRYTRGTQTWLRSQEYNYSSTRPIHPIYWRRDSPLIKRLCRHWVWGYVCARLYLPETCQWVWSAWEEQNNEDVFVKNLLGEDVSSDKWDFILSVAWFLSLGIPKILLRQVSLLGSHLGSSLIYLNKEISKTVSIKYFKWPVKSDKILKCSMQLTLKT